MWVCETKQTRSWHFCRGKPEVWGSFFPVLDQEVCMPNWSLAAGGDWLHYKEATTVSCWCLTCKSCWSKHTLSRGRRHCGYGHTGKRSQSNCLRMYSRKKCRCAILHLCSTFLCQVQYMWIYVAVVVVAGWFLWIPEKGQDISDEDKDLGKIQAHTEHLHNVALSKGSNWKDKKSWIFPSLTKSRRRDPLGLMNYLDIMKSFWSQLKLFHSYSSNPF